MAWKRVVTEIGMGTDIRGGGDDNTKAAVRALRDSALPRWSFLPRPCSTRALLSKTARPLMMSLSWWSTKAYHNSSMADRHEQLTL